MKTEEIKELLREKKFNEEELDSGTQFTYKEENVELIAYIEPGIEIEFISYYRWNRNDVKGTHNVSVKELEYTKDKVPAMFKKTLQQMPEYIGTVANAHTEVRKVIDKIFGI